MKVPVFTEVVAQALANDTRKPGTRGPHGRVKKVEPPVEMVAACVQHLPSPPMKEYKPSLAMRIAQERARASQPHTTPPTSNVRESTNPAAMWASRATTE